MTNHDPATPGASGTPMDLVGKTVRWEHEGRWFTANVTKFQPEVGVWDCVVVDPGTFRFWEPGHETYFGVRELVTVIDSEPYTEDEECE